MPLSHPSAPSAGAALRTLDSIRDPTMRAEVAAELEASDDHSPEADDHIVRSVLSEWAGRAERHVPPLHG